MKLPNSRELVADIARLTSEVAARLLSALTTLRESPNGPHPDKLLEKLRLQLHEAVDAECDILTAKFSPSKSKTTVMPIQEFDHNNLREKVVIFIVQNHINIEDINSMKDLTPELRTLLRQYILDEIRESMQTDNPETVLFDATNRDILVTEVLLKVFPNLSTGSAKSFCAWYSQSFSA